jgi:acetamidase/formamidase
VGHLPNRDSAPIATVSSGSVVTIDTVSHEGILEDQGRDPVRYFGSKGIPARKVLDDAKAIAASALEHDFAADGPHVVTGPIAVSGVAPGDVLKIEVLGLTPRAPYGVISNRHGKGALPGEFPEGPKPEPGADAAHPELFHNVSTFTPVRRIDGRMKGVLPVSRRFRAEFPIDPFMGMMGVALEAPLRATFGLTRLGKGSKHIPGGRGRLEVPFGETADHWLAVGLNTDLDEAMKQAVRESITFLSDELGMPRAVAYAYLSAATDYVV